MNFGESYLDLKTYRCLLPMLLYFCCGSGVAWCQGAIPRDPPAATQALHDLPFSVGRRLHFTFAFTFL